MSLREEIKTLNGNKRRFLLLRIADVDTKAALKLCGVVRGTYNNWLQNPKFVELYRRREEFAGDYQQEAIQLLRRSNQREAVFLEGKIVAKIVEEIDTGVYELTRTHLGREVYSKLMSDLDVVPKQPIANFYQRLQQIFAAPPNQIGEGEYIDGELATDNQQEEQLEASQLIQEGQQTSNAIEEKA